jgi:hypothetical protein
VPSPEAVVWVPVADWVGEEGGHNFMKGWTAKINGFSGIFGMYFDAFDPFGDWLNAKFVLLYFPDLQEEWVEHCSLQAGAYTQREDYLLHIRDFLRYPQLSELFNIGIIDLNINTADNALIFADHNPYSSYNSCL